MTTLLDVLRGILIGISFLIPGVSGGTMMILLGVFDDAIHSINELIHGRFYKIRSMFWMFIGVVLSLILFSSLIMFLLQAYEAYTLIFFLGIVLSGLFTVYQETQIKSIHRSDLMYGAMGVLIVLLLSFYNGIILDLTQLSSWALFIWLMILGVPLAVALILPGISTSLLLLSFGLYKITLDALIHFNLSILLPLMIGIILGTLILTHFLENQLRRYRRRTYLIILGFVVGSLSEILKLLSNTLMPSWPWIIIMFACGVLFMSAIQKIFTIK